MKLAYFDCIAGASGDMLLGALLHAGLAESFLQAELAKLKLDDFRLKSRPVQKNGFAAIKVDVLVKDDVPARHLPDIEAIVTESDLDDEIKSQAIQIFRRLGEVEAGIHGTALEEVHLHELGGVDTIVDVVGVLLGLRELGLEEIIVSPLPMGRGFIKGAHGQIPLPAPATLSLLKGVPIEGRDIKMELVTPTGAVLLSSLAHQFGEIPAMTLESIGYGAGGRDLEIPNVVRLLIGQTPNPAQAGQEGLKLLACNIDDLNPEFYAHVMDQLFQAGALDVFMSPIQMKKNRPATLLQVLSRPQDVEALKTILFQETSTLGLREESLIRHYLARRSERVETPYGPVRVKIAQLGPGQSKAAPEYEDCRQLAQSQGVALRTVYQAAEAAAANLQF